jgi:hypothetical protein
MMEVEVRVYAANKALTSDGEAMAFIGVPQMADVSENKGVVK